MSLPKTTLMLLLKLPPIRYTREDDSKMNVIPNIGVFIDTHRDLPHIGTFYPDIHRGECRPTMVHAYVYAGQVMLLNPETDQALKLHPKHLFVSSEWYQDWIVEQIMSKGNVPLDEEGKMPTKLLRDARSGVYLLQSFGHLVRQRATKEGIK